MTARAKPERNVSVEPTPFAQIPETVLYDERLSDKAVRLYGALVRHGTDPTDCYPSHARLAALIGCAARSIQRPLVELEQAGWIERIERIERSGRRTSDGFLVRTSSAVPAQEDAVPRAEERGTERAEERVLEREQDEGEPLNERLEIVLPAQTDPFDAFWSVYPRKLGKPAGRRHWTIATRTTHPDVILLGLDRWARYWRIERTEDRFMPHPATWLNQERWNDMPPTATAAKHDVFAEDPRRDGTSGRVTPA